ncbi:monofunctional biosynthetic peptidoglycan transglycosylase [Zavarzinia sp. CC-PAN008]|uniref:monofunctional biosynthetic peptidoglycan transglycosylase n=1 Tax=Zavarzinia sp. CC-PAN008 TaxID=3243332 RepID=UPI003F749455
MKPRGRRLWRLALAAVLALPAASVLVVLLWGLVPPPVTWLMVMRSIEDGVGIDAPWTPYDDIADVMKRTVVAAEDARFCSHHGFDWEAIEQALDRLNSGRSLRGGSTISQQVAKNVFLWPGRTWTRKGLEAGFTVLIEAFWSKQGILEMYLNVVEWEPGVYGIAAAARHHFDTTPDRLTARQAALLAAVLPNPLEWNAGRPGGYVSSRAATLQARARSVRPADMPPCGR